MKQMNRVIQRRVEWCGSGDFVFFGLCVAYRAILPDPARRAANDRRQPVNDLMTMSRDWPIQQELTLGNWEVDKV
jgi:hypothetical protein